MLERPAETNSNVDSSAPPSVAQLAGRFREQAAATKEKSPSNASHLPKIKVKSSPLIEKLQASLTFDPAALLPGASPKSPGLKAMVSPFHSPPSTPSSPGVRSQPSEAEAVPVSFDQPPEGTHLPCYNKVRTRGSIKRRPPSRRFRRSQSDCGDLGDFRAGEPSQENGAREENGDDVFPAKSQAPGPPSPGEGTLGEGSGGKLEPAEGRPGSRPASSAGQPPAPEPPPTSSPGAQNGRRSPAEETETGQEAPAAEEDGPGQESRDPETPEEGASGARAPQSPRGGADVPEKGEEMPEDGDTVEPDTGRESQTGGNSSTLAATLDHSAKEICSHHLPQGSGHNLPFCLFLLSLLFSLCISPVLTMETGN
uniref:RCSD domain containing 1 n=1 Tax=Jaculus jaculus TaxID=51337 RepID=A0A8C5KEZ5_JACJA